MAAGLRERGWPVSVLALDDSFPGPTPAALAQAARGLASIEDDTTVLVDGLAYGAMPAVVESEAARLRLVALVHHPLAAEAGIDPETAARLRASEARALAVARRVAVTSRATATALASYGIGGDRIAVVEPGTDRAPLAAGSEGGVRELLCVATLIPRKGHDVLLRALASLTHRDWHLTCVGSLERHPPTVDRLRAQLHETDLTHQVTLSGEVDHATLAQCYHRADVFVLASEYEGYGMAAAEALARGLPVVTTPTGAMPELLAVPADVDDGTRSDDCDRHPAGAAGMLVPPGDWEALASALHDLMSDDCLRARLADGARRVRDRLPDWEAAAARMAGVLESVGADG